MRCCGYDELFGEKLARKDARRYRRKGLRKTGRRIVELLGARGFDGVEVLEIGGGVGAIGLELLEAGAVRVTNVELSHGYEAVAGELLRERGLQDRVERLLGDVVAGEDVPGADVVVLERVVCCYPDADGLVRAAAGRARQALVLTFPRYGALTRVVIATINAALRLRRSEFRVFAHRPEALAAAATAEGLQPFADETVLVWRLLGFERT